MLAGSRPSWRVRRGSACRLVPNDLGAQARDFAKSLTGLLNGTVAHGVRLGCAESAPGCFIVGRGITKNQLVVRDLVPLTLDQKQASIFLLVTNMLVADGSGDGWLTVDRATYTLQASEAPGKDVLCSYDYARNVNNGYPEAHLHVYSPLSDPFSRVMEAAGRDPDPQDALHFAVGGAHNEDGGIHYRPILEDVIEMLIQERLVRARPGWETVVDAGRKRFYETQLRAEIRRNPAIARDAVARLDQDA